MSVSVRHVDCTVRIVFIVSGFTFIVTKNSFQLVPVLFNDLIQTSIMFSFTWEGFIKYGWGSILINGNDTDLIN